MSGGPAFFCQWKIEHQIRKCCVKGLILGNMAGRERAAGRPSVWKYLRAVTLPALNIFGKVKYYNEQRYFIRTLPVKAQNDKICKKIRGNGPVASLATPMVTRKEWQERTVLTWCSILQTKISQQRKRARHCRTPMKSNIVSIRCYVCLFCYQLDFPQTEIACWHCIRLCYLNQLEQFLVSFTWKNVSTLGLLHMVCWRCCNNTLLWKTCLHAVYHLSRALKRCTLYCLENGNLKTAYINSVPTEWIVLVYFIKYVVTITKEFT